jgi:outer membrane protein
MLASLAFSVAAQENKIGYVDTAIVLKDAPQAEAARKKLESEFAPRDQKIVEMQNELKSLDEEQARDGSTMSEAVRKRNERTMQSLKRDIKRAREEFIEDFNLRRNDEINKLQKLIDKTTVDIAKEEHFDLILRDNVLYSSKRIDITDKILERLKQQHRPDKSAIKSPPEPVN